MSLNRCYHSSTRQISRTSRTIRHTELDSAPLIIYETLKQVQGDGYVSQGDGYVSQDDVHTSQDDVHTSQDDEILITHHSELSTLHFTLSTF